jgi:hypothetical protein
MIIVHCTLLPVVMTEKHELLSLVDSVGVPVMVRVTEAVLSWSYRNWKMSWRRILIDPQSELDPFL